MHDPSQDSERAQELRTDGADQPPSPSPGEVTQLLASWREGDEAQRGRLVSLLYPHLRDLARIQLRRLRSGDTLGTTALVNEAYLRLLRHEMPVHDRAHFSALAATAMRHILVDHARRRMRKKRGDGQPHVSLDDPEQHLHLSSGPVAGQAASLLDLDRALEQLTQVSPRLAQVVECRYFAGMSDPEIAEALDLTDRTVRRDWVKARAWIYRALRPDEGAAASRS